MKHPAKSTKAAAKPHRSSSLVWLPALALLAAILAAGGTWLHSSPPSEATLEANLAAALVSAYGIDSVKSLPAATVLADAVAPSTPQSGGHFLDNLLPESVYMNYTIPAVRWDPHVPFARAVADRGLPVVLKHSVVDLWPARKRWTPQYLANSINEFDGLYRNTRNRFFGPYYDPLRPMAKAGLTSPLNPYDDDVRMSAKQFFKTIQEEARPGSPIHYFSGETWKLGPGVERDIEPLQELLSLRPDRSSINGWFGPAGALTPGHYDGFHNFFTQLYGRKRFVVFAPSDWQYVGIYPFLHPCHAQCVVNISHPDPRHAEQMRRAAGYEAVLEPGDMLYLPPLWFHMVESLEVSISVNVWTDSAQTVDMEQAFNAPIPEPPPSMSGAKARAQFMAFLLNHILETLPAKLATGAAGSSFAATFVSRVYSVRYLPVIALGQIPADADYAWNSGATRGRGLCDAVPPQRATELKALFREDKTISKYVAHITAKFAALPDETRELWLGNYAEYIGANAVDVALVANFLRDVLHCR